jgi:hypothetical protein
MTPRQKRLRMVDKASEAVRLKIMDEKDPGRRQTMQLTMDLCDPVLRRMATINPQSSEERVDAVYDLTTALGNVVASLCMSAAGGDRQTALVLSGFILERIKAGLPQAMTTPDYFMDAENPEAKL